jgi:hypothetical protein
MGNPITTASLYAGEAGAYIGAAAKSGKTLADGQITILEGIKYKKTLTVVSSASLIADADCDFSDGTLTLTDRALEPTDKKLNLSLCATDLEKDWQAAQMAGGANNSNMAGDFPSFIMEYLGAQIGENIETQIWTDMVANLTSDGNVVDITAGTLSAANIVAEMEKVYDAVPAAVYGQDDLRIYVGTNAVRFYIQAMSELGYLNAYYAGDVPLLFEGVEIVHAPGLAADTMVAARVSNIYWGTDLQSDATTFKVLDQRESSGANEIRIAANFSSGVQHAVGGDIVLYS